MLLHLTFLEKMIFSNVLVSIAAALATVNGAPFNISTTRAHFTNGTQSLNGTQALKGTQALNGTHEFEKRDSQTCEFPSDKGLVPVTSGSSNGGWAMSPDQKCTGGSYCPYACPSGKLMAQWDKSATSYSYPKSMNGGLYCNKDGKLSKPMEDKDYCVDGEGTLKAKNNAGSDVAFCQTVLPGNEAMLIPTKVGQGSDEELAVPGPDYWDGTAAHYYVNPPGVSTDDACTWGTKDKSQGNWAPYVAGANMDNNGNTYVKIGWNPKYVEDFSGKTPNFGIRVTCDNKGDCDGLDCEINPKHGSNKASGSSTGNQQGAAYCIVTAKNKASAKIEVFSA